MVLRWSGLPVTQDEVAAQVYTPGRRGTLQSDVIAAARRHGRLAVPVTRPPDLTAELAAGHPVVVFQNLGLGWFPVWHYAVAIGYDLAAGDLILHSGLAARRMMPLHTFERTWARGDHWGLVVLPPQEPPVAADEVAVLRAATGLEQAGRFRAAATAYAAIAERSPDNLEAWTGSAMLPTPRVTWSRQRPHSGRRPGAIQMLRRPGTILLTFSAKRGGGRKPSRPRGGQCVSAAPTRRPIARPCVEVAGG
jgi:Tetratricopeptide repeat